MLASCLLALPGYAAQASAQGAAPQQQDRLIAEAPKVDYRVGDKLNKGAWTLNAALKPDIYTAELNKGERREVCFMSGANSLCRTVGIGDQYDFIITHAGVDYPTRIVGAYVPPMAVFDTAYQNMHRGKTRISIPEMYELVNIAIALTPKAQEDRFLVEKDTPYYRELMTHFAPVKDHPFVTALDQGMRKDMFRYFRLKMNGYAFDFDNRGKIVRNPRYDRTGFSGDKTNDLLPYLAQMQDFADKSGFRKFYAAHRAFYNSQISYYRDSINIAEMLTWLRTQFPDVKPYDTTNIIFSPLVAGSQSLTWMESNGFRELQPHVNFPYPGKGDVGLSPEAVALRRGYILFTELNHGFINPTADLYQPRIRAALDHRDYWAKKGSSSDGYGNAYSLFNEMMNWGLVSLYLVDKAPAAERDALIGKLNPMMGAEGRGFPQFPRFNAFLVDLYKNRAAGATVASLYPKIIEWFEQQDDAPKPQTISPSTS
jgi:hypothetical protein